MRPLGGRWAPGSAGTTEIDLLRRAIEEPATRVLSVDVFDTVMLRDASTETDRLRAAARSAAAQLGVNPAVLTRLRWLAQENAYRAVRMERPTGDATLRAIHAASLAPLGIGDEGVEVFRTAELAVDGARLRPNPRILDIVSSAAARGVRVIAVSDIYYSATDVQELFSRVVGGVPVETIYTSADLGATKHAGTIFPIVAAREGAEPASFVHTGDTLGADVIAPKAAGWRAFHVPVPGRERARRSVERMPAIPAALRRAR